MTSYLPKPNDIRRHITGGATRTELERKPAQLQLAEYDGRLWASNRYWVTPATRVLPLLEQYNLEAGPGWFAVDGGIRPMEAPMDPEAARRRLATILDPAAYGDPAAKARLGSDEALIQRGKHVYAVYQTADGALLGLPADEADWLTALPQMQLIRPQAFELGPDEHFAEVRVLTQGRGAKPVLLVADVIKTVRHASYGTDPGTREQTYHEAETENAGPRVIGALMAVKVGEE